MLSNSEQRLMLSLGVFVLGVVMFELIWQPTQQRLTTTELQYQQQLALATHLRQVEPRDPVSVAADQPLSLRTSKTPPP